MKTKNNLCQILIRAALEGDKTITLPSLSKYRVQSLPLLISTHEADQKLYWFGRQVLKYLRGESARNPITSLVNRISYCHGDKRPNIYSNQSYAGIIDAIGREHFRKLAKAATVVRRETFVRRFQRDYRNALRAHFYGIVGELNAEVVFNAGESISVAFRTAEGWDRTKCLSGSIDAWELFWKLSGEEAVKHINQVVGELNVETVYNADKSIDVVFYDGAKWDLEHCLSGSAEAWELFLKLAGEEAAKPAAVRQ